MAGDDACTTATKELDQTPTWAVAGVCAAMILISIILEKSLHRVGTWLLRKQKNALFEAIEKVKSELMILGFISLLLTFFQKYIIKICVSTKAGKTMLPCRYEEQHRRLLLLERRFLADAGVVKCKAGYVPIISSNGLHDLHILLFFLAVLHVINSVITMTLGRLKIRRWKEWELETSSPDYEFSNDPARIRLTHETSFVRAHTSFWTRIPFFFYIGCFFRQFFRSVSKADYLTLRNGFISVHLAPGSKFNFQKYIKRSLEDDFKVVVGVSNVLWVSFLVFLLVDVHGWQALFWASLVPLLIILAAGTKLQAILTMMALEISEKHSVVQGIPLVQVSDKYFWFGRPRLLIHLIHFTLFQNAFQITYFLWIWYTFGLRSCFHHNFKLVLIKDILGIGVLFLCSYITLPLYALVTQMGSTYKKSIFDEETKQAIKKWHLNAKRHGGGRAGRTPTSTPGISPSPSMPRASPSMAHQASAAALHRFKTTGHSGRRPVSCGDHELDDFEGFGHDDGDDDREQGELRDAESREFSFVKPAAAKGP